MNLSDKIYKFNIKKQLKNKINTIVKECLRERKSFNVEGEGFSFLVNTKYKEYLYDIFLKKCKKVLNKFTLKDTNLKCWCYFSNKNFTKTAWHNHIKTCTINGVLYLKLPKNEKGIDFKINDKIFNFVPKKFDFIIFPNYMEHYPHPSFSKEVRISMNLELRCFENSKEIFK